MDQSVSAPELLSEQAATVDRARTSVDCAMVVCWMWLVLLAAVAAACAYLFVVFAGFGAEALDGEMTAQVYLLALGLPALAFVVAAVAGVGTARTLARRTSRSPVFARVYPWMLGTSTAVVGALVAATVFYGVLTVAEWLL